MRLTTKRLAALRTVTAPTLADALKYMRDQQLEIRSDVPGYVVFFNGKACGWGIQPRCSDWRPGCVMVDLQTGAQFELVGGNYDAGGERWNQLSHES
jgi:hypothetical protein